MLSVGIRAVHSSHSNDHLSLVSAACAYSRHHTILVNCGDSLIGAFPHQRNALFICSCFQCDRAAAFLDIGIALDKHLRFELSNGNFKSILYVAIKSRNRRNCYHASFLCRQSAVLVNCCNSGITNAPLNRIIRPVRLNLYA